MATGIQSCANRVKRTNGSPILSLLLGAGFLCGAASQSCGASLRVEITSRFAGENLQLASLRYQNPSGESFSITRVSYLVSDFALQRADGSWLEISNSVAWLDAERTRNSARFDDIPLDAYRAVRFSVGLDAGLNHADAAAYPATHPLNPNFDGLHWSWQGGYIFLALEGLWRNSAGQLDGWAYHLARDTNCTRIDVAAPIDIRGDTRLELDFDLSALLCAPRPLSFAKDGSSTHSRDGDPLSAALVANLPGAFRGRKVSALSEAEITAIQPKPRCLPAKCTPYALQISARVPIPDLPRDNPLIAERVELGERLFGETALSKDGSISCASCHKADAAFSDSRRYSLGVRGQTGARNAMPLFNLAWKSSFFWDGRAPSLRAQVLMPIEDHSEMDESATNVCAKMQSPGAHQGSSGYPATFERAFGSREITPEKIGLAIENYLLTLTSFDAKFDRVLDGKAEFTREEQSGFELFATEYDPRRGQYGADCFHCHGGSLFQSQSFANNGLDSEFSDLGRGRITGKDSDRGKFAVPSLRNVEVTAPYMHDGRFRTLEEVVEHYCTGLRRSATLDPNLAKHPDGGVPLSAADKKALVAFLKTLTDARFEKKALLPGALASFTPP